MLELYHAYSREMSSIVVVVVVVFAVVVVVVVVVVVIVVVVVVVVFCPSRHTSSWSTCSFRTKMVTLPPLYLQLMNGSITG